MKRLLSTVFFGGAFIWVAVIFFDVPREIIWVFFVLTVWVVLALIAVGLVGGLLLRQWRSRRSGERWFEKDTALVEDMSESLSRSKNQPPRAE